ncbi:unnamed protein product, partial [Ectocarpus sp. 6 AP-2014]
MGQDGGDATSGGDGGEEEASRSGSSKGEEDDDGMTAVEVEVEMETETAKPGGRLERKEEDEGEMERQRQLEARAKTAEAAAAERSRAAAAAAAAAAAGDQERGFVEKRVDELEQQEAAALAAALAAASTLPSFSLPPRRYTAGVISPRLGSPTYLASKGFGSFSGMSASERDSEWHTAGAAAGKQCRSLEDAFQAAEGESARGGDAERSAEPPEVGLVIPAWAPPSPVFEREGEGEAGATAAVSAAAPPPLSTDGDLPDIPITVADTPTESVGSSTKSAGSRG